MEPYSSTCSEHNDLSGVVNTIKGQLSILLSLVVVLIAGMTFAISQNHKAEMKLADVTRDLSSTKEMKLADVTRDLSSTKEMIIASKNLHDLRLAKLEDGFSSITSFCCGELDAL